MWNCRLFAKAGEDGTEQEDGKRNAPAISEGTCYRHNTECIWWQECGIISESMIDETVESCIIIHNYAGTFFLFLLQAVTVSAELTSGSYHQWPFAIALFWVFCWVILLCTAVFWRRNSTLACVVKDAAQDGKGRYMYPSTRYCTCARQCACAIAWEYEGN